MKKFDKKGFTIVELVIVIAVIAILAGIMIPTFANVTDSAKKAAVEAKAAEAYKNAMAADMADGYQDYETDAAETIAGLTYMIETETDAVSGDVVSEKVVVKYTNDQGTATYENGEWDVTLD